MIFGRNVDNDRCSSKTECEPIRLERPSVLQASGDDHQATFNPIRAADLFNQQLWCWSRDIDCPGGNLLVRYGFQRIQKPRGSSDPSLYRLDISPSARVILRGFGVFYGDDRWGGLFLRRCGFSPRMTPAADLPRPLWSDEDLPRLTDPLDDDLPRCRRLLLELIDWIRQYEVWILETKGVDYRRATLLPWLTKKKSVTPAAEMARAWRSLGVAIAADSKAVATECSANGSHSHD